MALWKPFRGSRSDLDSIPKHDGYVYFCDDGSLFFDYTDAAGVLQRKQINAKEAETLTGKTLDEIQKSINYNDLLNKPVLGDLSSKDTVSKSDLSSDVQTSLGKADSALQSYTETDPTVPSWAKASTKPSYTKSEVGLGNVDNVKQYSASNPPPYPVTKVNNKTGAVTLSASDVGADASGTASSAVTAHNTNTSAHADIREQVNQLSSEKVNVSQLNSAVNTAKNETIAEVDNMLSTEVEIEVENQLDGMRSDIVTELITQLGGLPVFGTVDDNKTITTTSLLPDGTYVLRYKDTNGSYSDLTTFVIDTGTGGDTPDYYEVDIAAIGYTDNARWSISSGTLKTDTSAQGYTAINIVPITRPSGKTVTIELSGIIFTGKSNAAILPYVNDEFNPNGAMYLNEDHDYSDATGLKNFCHEDGSVTVVWDKGDWTGFKFNGYGSGANAKITYTIE
jgi:hypothetical protein